MHRSKDTAEPEIPFRQPVADSIPGRSTSKMAPRGGSLTRNASRPPCVCIIDRQIVRPIPIPLGFVV